MAAICAGRNDTLMQISNGSVAVHIGHGPDKGKMSARCGDDEKIMEIIRELNFGQYKNTVK